MDRYQGCFHNVRFVRCCLYIRTHTQTRTLVTASEKLQWPLPVDYTVATPAERKEFEDAFFNLARLQTVYGTLDSISARYADSVIVETSSTPHTTNSGQRRTACTRYRLLYYRGRYASSTISRARGRRIGWTRSVITLVTTYQSVHACFQPEWYLTHVVDAAHTHRPFMESVIQQLLSKTEYKNIVAWVSIIVAD